MPVRFSTVGPAESIVASRPDPSVLSRRPDSAEAETQRVSRPDEAAKADTFRPIGQTSATETRGDFTRGERVDRREIGQRLESAASKSGVAQAAKGVIRSGRDDLETLDNLARDANDRQVDQARADEVRQRLREADQDPSLQQVRREAEADGLAQQAEAAEAESQQAARQVLERPSLPEQSTLALVPQGVGAQDPEDEAQAAESEASEARARAQRADQQQQILGSPDQRPVLEPRQSDISSPEQAEETRNAVAEADARAVRLEDQVSRFEQQAADEARALTEEFAAGRSGPRLTTSRDAEETAREVARSTVANPEQAVSTQPFLSVEAALRVLA